MVILSLFASRADADDLRDWGEQTLLMIQHDFPNTPDLWTAGVQLSALNAAAKVDRKHLPDAEHYASWMLSYFGQADLTKGLAAKPKGGHFYDDNEWVVLDRARIAASLTGDPTYLTESTEIFRFIQTGRDGTFGGGIWWQHKHDGKNTCSNAPAIVAALELYQATHDEKYLTTARQLYDWTNAHFLDTDGLYFDHLSIDGSLDKTKWSYNTALIIRANLLFAEILHEPKYLSEAQRSAKAAVAHWVQSDGAIADDASFAHLFCGALIKLSAADHDPAWRAVVVQALKLLHEKCRDPLGHFAEHWNEFPTQEIEKPSLRAQCAAARSFFEASNAIPPSTQP